MLRDVCHGDSDVTRRCALCGREVARLTEHHLTPREYGGRETARLCAPCHLQVHALFRNGTLAAHLSSLGALRREPAIARYLRWVRRQPDRHIPVRAARRRR
jgi:5-methylcytosine-specific restriction enzyme A